MALNRTRGRKGYKLPAGSRVFNPTKPHKAVPDTTFLDPRYYGGGFGPLVKGYWHTGIDINGPYGGDTDLGQPIFAIAEGTVIFAGRANGLWGNLVVIQHPKLGVWTRYGHLDEVFVKAGDVLEPGTIIGTLGKGAKTPSFPHGIFPAHLHFDVIYAELPSPDHWPSRYGNKAEVLAYYTDPTLFLRKWNAVDVPGNFNL